MLSYIEKEEFNRILGNKDLSLLDKASLFANFTRINTLYMIAKAGSGHIGTSFSSMDVFTWLYLNELGDDDIFFSSKGHDAPGLYSVLIGLGRLEYKYLHRLRRLGGLPGHPDISIEGMETNTGSLGMGVSKAKGFVKANRLDGKKSKVYVLTGDGELQEGQFWESLPGAVNNKCSEITIIVDHNKIQSDTWVADVSDLGDLEAKFTSFGFHVQRCNGNDFAELSKAFEIIKTVDDRPQVIIADTIKGCGVSLMESPRETSDMEFYRFHSGAPCKSDYEQAVEQLYNDANSILANNDMGLLELTKIAVDAPHSSQDSLQRLIPSYENALYELGRQHEDIIVLDADLMIDCGLLKFRNEYPERFMECGIAEQDMISQAGALALKGKLPIAHSFACFMAPRANEQFFNNATEHTKCIYVGSLAGLLPSGPGHSHQMIRDISILGSIPGMKLLEPCCEEEVGRVLKYAVEENATSTYIRLVSIPYDIPYQLPEGYSLEAGKGTVLRDGRDVIVFGYGPVMLSEAFNAAEKVFKDFDINVKIVNLPWLNVIDRDWLCEAIGEIKNVITIDNHLISGGQGEKIAVHLSQAGLTNLKLTALGLDGIPACGRNCEVLEYHGLDSESIAKLFCEAIK